MTRSNKTRDEESSSLAPLQKGKKGERVFQISVGVTVSTTYDKAHNKVPNIVLQYLNLQVYETRLQDELDQKPSLNQ